VTGKPSLMQLRELTRIRRQSRLPVCDWRFGRLSCTEDEASRIKLRQEEVL